MLKISSFSALFGFAFGIPVSTHVTIACRPRYRINLLSEKCSHPLCACFLSLIFCTDFHFFIRLRFGEGVQHFDFQEKKHLLVPRMQPLIKRFATRVIAVAAELYVKYNASGSLKVLNGNSSGLAYLSMRRGDLIQKLQTVARI